MNRDGGRSNRQIGRQTTNMSTMSRFVPACSRLQSALHVLVILRIRILCRLLAPIGGFACTEEPRQPEDSTTSENLTDGRLESSEDPRETTDPGSSEQLDESDSDTDRTIGSGEPGVDCRALQYGYGWNSPAAAANCELAGAYLEDADLAGADLRGADLTDAKLSGANLVDSDLSGALLTAARFERADLTRANLQGARVQGRGVSATVVNGDNNILRFRGAVMRQARLVDANLYGTEFDEADLTDADLTRTRLMDVRMDRAILERAVLVTANLTSASLRCSDLSGAQLSMANLTKANLAGSKLIGADLADVRWLQTTCPDMTVADGTTIASCESRLHVPANACEVCSTPGCWPF